MIGSETLTITRSTSGGTDMFGDPLPGGTTSHDSEGWSLQPRESTELTDARDTVIIGLTGFGPAGADIKATDNDVRHEGVRYQVDGEPGRWRDVNGVERFVQVALKRVQG